MMRTFCAVIGDPEADAVLSPYGELFGRLRHWSFKQIHVLSRPVTDVKREALIRFGVTARQFNGVRFDLDQAVAAWRGTAAFTVQRLKDSVEATKEKVASLARQLEKATTDRRNASLKFKLVGKKQRLDVLLGRLDVAERELVSSAPRVCFGGRAGLRAATADGELWRWQARRNGRIFLVGSKSEGAHGNQSVHWDGECLRLRMPDALGGGCRTLDGVRFRYGQSELLALLERNRDAAKRVGVTWLIYRDDAGRWNVRATVEEPGAAVTSHVSNGVMAVDLNVDHLAVTVVDRFGNPTSRFTLAFPDATVDAGRAAVVIGDSVRALCLLAHSRGYGVACEKLDFSRKKAGLREYGAAHARRLSGWSYSKFFAVLSARCARDGVELRAVNPSFTSVIGKLKYARGRAMSAHHAAALVIGRRAMGYGERLAAMDGVNLDGPARNRPRVDWRRWRGVRRLPRKGAIAPVMTAGSVMGTTSKGGRRRPASGRGRVPAGVITGDVPSPAWGAVALATVTVVCDG